METKPRELTDLEIDEYIEVALAETFSKPGTADVTPADRYKLRHLLKHYAKKAHPFTACKRDQMKHGLSEEHANRRCAVLKDIIKGSTSWRKGGGKKNLSEEEQATYALHIPDDFIVWLTETPEEEMLQEAEKEGVVFKLKALLGLGPDEEDDDEQRYSEEQDEEDESSEQQEQQDESSEQQEYDDEDENEEQYSEEGEDEEEADTQDDSEDSEDDASELSEDEAVADLALEHDISWEEAVELHATHNQRSHGSWSAGNPFKPKKKRKAEHAAIKAREREKYERSKTKGGGAKDPKKMTDEELKSAIQFSTQAVDRGLPTQEERRRMAIRHQDLIAEREKRREQKALGYDYSPKGDKPSGDGGGKRKGGAYKAGDTVYDANGKPHKVKEVTWDGRLATEDGKKLDKGEVSRNPTTARRQAAGKERAAKEAADRERNAPKPDTRTAAQKQEDAEKWFDARAEKRLAERKANPTFKAAKKGDRVSLRSPVKGGPTREGTVVRKDNATGQIIVKPDTPFSTLNPDANIAAPPEYVTLNKKRQKNLEAESDEPISLAYQLPYDLSEPEKISKKLWRKHILPLGKKVNYTRNGVSQVLNFSKETLQQMVKNFHAKAFDKVYFTARHSRESEDSRGVVRDVFLGEDGLYADIEVSEDGEKLLANSLGEIGTSVSYDPDYVRQADGKAFGPSLQHIAAVPTPHVPGLKAWELIEMAEAREVVDLTEAEYSAPETERSGPELAETATKPEGGVKKGASVTWKQGDQTLTGIVISIEGDTATVRTSDGNTVRVPLRLLTAKAETKKGGVEMEQQQQETVSLEEFNALRERLESNQRVIRNQGIERLLESRKTLQRNGKRYAVPKTHIDAAHVILSALEGTESDVVELSASGSASLKEDEVGNALSTLLSPPELVELGESGATDVDSTPDDPEERIELAIAEKRKENPQLSYADAFDIVLTEGVS